MKLFCHVAEFGDEGWRLLPVACLLFKKVALWAPSATHLAELHKEGDSVLGPLHLLELVRLGRVQIIASEWWLTSPKERNDRSATDWPHYRWTDYFDGPVREMASDYLRAPSRDSPVIVAPEEEGMAWAHKRGTQGTYYRRATKLWANKVLPPGVLDKAERAKERGNDPVRTVLRDAKNHEDAVLIAASDAPIEPSDAGTAFAYIMQRKPRSERSYAADPIDPSRVRDLLALSQQLSPLEDARDLVQRIRGAADQDFSEELYAVLKADIPIPETLVSEIRKGAKSIEDMSLWRAFLPQSKWHGVTTMGGLALLVASLNLGSLNAAAFSLLSFSIWAMGSGAGVAQKLGITKAPYSGPTFPFVISHRTAEPNVRQIHEILQKIVSV